MNIQFDNEMLKTVVADAILKHLDQTARDNLIQGALQHLLEPQSTGYGRKEAPINHAFNDALARVASKVATEMFETDEVIKSHLQKLINDTVTKFMDEKRETVVTRMVNAMVTSFTS